MHGASRKPLKYLGLIGSSKIPYQYPRGNDAVSHQQHEPVTTTSHRGVLALAVNGLVSTSPSDNDGRKGKGY